MSAVASRLRSVTVRSFTCLSNERKNNFSVGADAEQMFTEPLSISGTGDLRRTEAVVM